MLFDFGRVLFEDRSVPADFFVLCASLQLRDSFFPRVLWSLTAGTAALPSWHFTPFIAFESQVVF